MRNKTWTLIAGAIVLMGARIQAEDVVEVGSRLELFVDHALVESVTGDAALKLQRPEPQEVVLTTDKPWEGNTCAYYTIFQDGDLYRMYYRGSHFDEQTQKAAHLEVACYAESRDGIHWVRPELGLFEFEGSKSNNIVWAAPGGTHNFTPFKDTNPDCAPEAQYKALARVKGGLLAYQSADGIHWSQMSDEPVITKGAFDSQNLAFFDNHARMYREYHRTFRGVRDIQLGTSSDFLNWTDPVFLDYGDVPLQHLYTNAIQPCPRAPHILIGFPTRFLPDEGSRVEPTFMASRDGLHFERWLDPVIPEDAPEDRDGNRSNYMTWGVLQLPGKDREYSVYATEAYYTGPDSRVRRFTYRVDGFTSLSAGADGGELVTKPIIFEGERLVLNIVSRGQVRVELQTIDGTAIEGFSLGDCTPVTGDEVSTSVRWKGGANTSALAGQPVRLRFALVDADVYSWRFTD